MSLLGKTILIYGPPGTGKTLLAKRLEKKLREGDRLVNLFDDIQLSRRTLFLARCEPEGTTTIITTNHVPDGCFHDADVLVKMNSKAFAELLLPQVEAVEEVISDV